MRSGLGALLILPLMVPLVSQAQETPQVRPGDRVRVTAPDCQLQKEKGTVSSFDGHIFSATVRGRDIECPVEALTRLDVSVGERKWWEASLVGMGVGAGVALIVGISITSSASEYDDTAGLAAILYGLVSTGAGLVTGTAIGFIRGTDKWEQVPLPLVQPSLFVSGGSRLNLGISIPLRRCPMRPFEVLLLLAVVGTVVPTETSFSQERSPIRPGDRVRVTAPDCELRKQTGVLASLDRDLFTAALGGLDIQCPTGAVTRLEVSVGERKWWKISLFGLGIGAGAGVVTGVAVCAGDEGDVCGVLALVFTAITSAAGRLLRGPYFSMGSLRLIN